MRATYAVLLDLVLVSDVPSFGAEFFGEGGALGECAVGVAVGVILWAC